MIPFFIDFIISEASGALFSYENLVCAYSSVCISYNTDIEAAFGRTAHTYTVKSIIQGFGYAVHADTVDRNGIPVLDFDIVETYGRRYTFFGNFVRVIFGMESQTDFAGCDTFQRDIGLDPPGSICNGDSVQDHVDHVILIYNHGFKAVVSFRNGEIVKGERRIFGIAEVDGT